MTNKNKIVIILISATILVLLAILIISTGKQKKEITVIISKEEVVNAEFIRTESVECNSSSYILETVFVEETNSINNIWGYFNNIYRNTNSTENFIASIKAPALGGNTFFILAAPKENCDRIYLTVARYETDAPLIGIFEWKITDNTLRELSISSSFRADLAINYPDGLEKVISPDGDYLLVTQRESEYSYENPCDLRSLLLLNLREDKYEVLVHLPKGELLTSFNRSESTCPGIDIGWLDNTTVYYDVYDATSEEWIYPLVERRMLSI